MSCATCATPCVNDRKGTLITCVCDLADWTPLYEEVLPDETVKDVDITSKANDITPTESNKFNVVSYSGDPGYPEGRPVDWVIPKESNSFDTDGFTLKNKEETLIKKADQGKTDMSLLEYFPLALEALCKVSEFGCKKYERGSFKDVPNARSRYTSAMLRHHFQEGTGDTPELDAEMELPHDLMTMWNAICRVELRLRGYKKTESNK